MASVMLFFLWCFFFFGRLVFCCVVLLLFLYSSSLRGGRSWPDYSRSAEVSGQCTPADVNQVGLACQG